MKTLYQKIRKKFSKVRTDSLTFDFRAVSFQDMTLAITNIISLSKIEVTLHLALAEVDTRGFIGRSIKCCSMRYFHKYAGEFIYESLHDGIME